MEKIIIEGGRSLHGTVEINGMKNAALPIILASILTRDVCVIEHLPAISDVTLALEILRSMGAGVRMINRTTVEIDSRHIVGGSSPYELVSKMRGSTYLIGAELGCFSAAKVGWPGGCDFGVRPIDQHIKGFEALGAKVDIENGYIIASAPDGLRGGTVYFDCVTVGATINVMIAAVLAKGNTVIDNAAREPHIVDLANFLNTCGAKITGAGTGVIRISGVEKLHGCTYTIIPDMIEAGTYMAAVAAAGGNVRITNVIPKHLEVISAKLVEMGADIEEYDDSITISSTGELRRANVKTLPYPGFPTDMHPQISAALCCANGASIVTEGIWENRFRYVDELRKMGADISVDGRTATIFGVERLTGAPVRAVDLRAGAAMIIAGLAAEGRTEISGIGSIERGYDDIVGKLTRLGANIKKVYCPDEGEMLNAN
ncbi:MAG: UDP-N-acetylglucosamine 1-carboxyvinyltransferase [Clostridia bacterium]|nr:UDP-N-acetylglucosamine 1-carboxyvinyltransferase [Clostridia bacterium]